MLTDEQKQLALEAGFPSTELPPMSPDTALEAGFPFLGIED